MDCGRNALKRDAVGAGEVDAQDLDRAARLSLRRFDKDERAKTRQAKDDAGAYGRRQISARRDLEDGTDIVLATVVCRAVEVSVIRLNRRGFRMYSVRASALRTEGVERCQGAAGCDLEHSAVAVGPASILGSSIEIPVGRAGQPSERPFAVLTAAFGNKKYRASPACRSG